jgi:hypothetical protein
VRRQSKAATALWIDLPWSNDSSLTNQKSGCASIALLLTAIQTESKAPSPLRSAGALQIVNDFPNLSTNDSAF